MKKMKKMSKWKFSLAQSIMYSINYTTVHIYSYEIFREQVHLRISASAIENFYKKK